MPRTAETTTPVLDRSPVDEVLRTLQQEIDAATVSVEEAAIEQPVDKTPESPVVGAKAIYFDDRSVLRGIGRRVNMRGAFNPAGTDAIRRRNLGGFVVNRY